MRNAAILYGCFVALLFAPFLLRGEVFVPADTLSASYPWRGEVDATPHNIDLQAAAQNDYPRDHFFNQSLKSDVFPLWNRYIFSGHPTIGSGRSGLFYPPRLLLHRVCRTGVAKTVLQMSHLFAAGLAMFWFFRTRGWRVEAGTLGGLVWMGNSYMACWLEFEGVVVAGVYLPLLLVCFEKAGHGNARWWLAVAPLSALCLLGGDLQAGLLTLTIFFVYTSVRWRVLRRVQPLSWALGAAILTLLLSAPELLPLWQLMDRSQSGFLQAADQAGLGSALLFFLNPDLLGNPTTGWWFSAQRSYPDFALFVGTVPLILAITAGGREANVLKFLAVSALLISSSSLPLASSVLFIPAKAVMIVAFCLSCLTAIGMQQLADRESYQNRCRRLAGLLGLLGVGLLSATIFLSWHPSLLMEWWHGQAGLLRMPSAGSPEQEVVAAFTRNYPRNPQLWAALAAALALSFKPGNLKLLSGITLLELVLFASGFNTTVAPGQLFPEIPETRRLAGADTRVVAIDSAPGNSLVPYGVSLLNGHEALVSSDYRRAIQQADPLAVLPTRTLPLRRLDRPILDALSVRYALLPPEGRSRAQGWTLSFQGPGGNIYRNDEACDRFFLVGRAVPLHNLTQVELFDPRLEAFVEEQPPSNLTPGPGRVSGLKETANSLELLVETETHQLLVVSDAYHPDWKVWVNDERMDLQVANLASRGVYLPPGVHRVVFRFQPWSVVWGVRLCLFGLFFLILGLVWSFWRG